MLQRKKRTAPATVAGSSTETQIAQGSSSTTGAKRSTTVLNRDSYVTVTSEIVQLGKLVRRARGQLKPLARANSTYERGKAVTDLGDIDGAHIVLMVGKVDIDGDGAVGSEEFSRFLVEAADLIGSVQSSVLNTSIVAALMLTIVLPMLLAPFDEFSEPSSQDQLGSVFADAAGFFTGSGGSEAAMSARKGLYAAECVLLGLTCCMNITGVFVAVAFYGCLASLPGPVAAVTFMLENCAALSTLQMLWALSLLGLILSVPLAAARASAMAFFVALAASVCSVVFTQVVMLPCWKSQLRIFHEEALALVGEGDTDHAGDQNDERTPPMPVNTGSEAAKTSPHVDA